jgi:hypothetical protein
VPGAASPAALPQAGALLQAEEIAAPQGAPGEERMPAAIAEAVSKLAPLEAEGETPMRVHRYVPNVPSGDLPYQGAQLQNSLIAEASAAPAKAQGPIQKEDLATRSPSSADGEPSKANRYQLGQAGSIGTDRKIVGFDPIQGTIDIQAAVAAIPGGFGDSTPKQAIFLIDSSQAMNGQLSAAKAHALQLAAALFADGQPEANALAIASFDASGRIALNWAQKAEAGEGALNLALSAIMARPALGRGNNANLQAALSMADSLWRAAPNIGALRVCVLLTAGEYSIEYSDALLSHQPGAAGTASADLHNTAVAASSLREAWPEASNYAVAYTTSGGSGSMNAILSYATHPIQSHSDISPVKFALARAGGQVESATMYDALSPYVEFESFIGSAAGAYYKDGTVVWDVLPLREMQVLTYRLRLLPCPNNGELSASAYTWLREPSGQGQFLPKAPYWQGTVQIEKNASGASGAGFAYTITDITSNSVATVAIQTDGGGSGSALIPFWALEPDAKYSYRIAEKADDSFEFKRLLFNGAPVSPNFDNGAEYAAQVSVGSKAVFAFVSEPRVGYQGALGAGEAAAPAAPAAPQAPEAGQGEPAALPEQAVEGAFENAPSVVQGPPPSLSIAPSRNSAKPGETVYYTVQLNNGADSDLEGATLAISDFGSSEMDITGVEASIRSSQGTEILPFRNAGAFSAATLEKIAIPARSSLVVRYSAVRRPQGASETAAHSSSAQATAAPHSISAYCSVLMEGSGQQSQSPAQMASAPRSGGNLEIGHYAAPRYPGVLWATLANGTGQSHKGIYFASSAFAANKSIALSAAPESSWPEIEGARYYQNPAQPLVIAYSPKDGASYPESLNYSMEGSAVRLDPDFALAPGDELALIYRLDFAESYQGSEYASAVGAGSELSGQAPSATLRLKVANSAPNPETGSAGYALTWLSLIALMGALSFGIASRLKTGRAA